MTQLTVRATVWSHDLRWVTALSTLSVSRQSMGISSAGFLLRTSAEPHPQTPTPAWVFNVQIRQHLKAPRKHY